MILGVLRVKNEARWIAQVLRSLRPVCEALVVMDDASEDDTAAQAGAEGALVLPSPFEGLDEARDKTWLMGEVAQLDPEWIVMIDGDEVLADPDRLLAEIKASRQPVLSLPVLYLWDSPDQYRVDGVYGAFHRSSVFRYRPGLTFGRTSHGGNFHCSSSPRELAGHCGASKARLLHYGYMYREDRLRKYEWYNEHDPNSTREDRYRHMVVGDIFPATTRFRYGGPLELRPIEVPALACR